MDLLNEQDFASQELASYGRSHRESIPTDRINIHNQMMSKQAESRSRRKNARQNRVEPPAPARLIPRMEGAGLTVQPPTQPLSAATNTTPAAQPALLSDADAVALLRQLGPDFLSQFNFPSAAANSPQFAPLAASDFELSPEEQQELEDDPDANETEFSDFGTGINSIRADQALSDANQAVRNTNITSTPVPLRTQTLVRQGVTGRRTPTATTPQAHLTRRTHTVPPTPSRDKENTPISGHVQPLAFTTPSKRSHGDDSLDSDEDDEDEAAARIGDESIHQKKKGVRASDLGPARKRIIERAWRHFRFRVAAFPYPGEDLVNKWARESWYAGLGELVEGMGYIGSSDPTEDEMALLRQRVYQLRGQIKLRAREIVAARLSLNNSTNVDIVNKNRELIQTYKDHNNFIFRNPFNPTEPASIFRSIMIEDMLIKMWYNERSKSEAILTPMYFENGIPLETLALICAGLQNALDEWQTGIFVKIPFGVKVYEPVYDMHLTNLRNWHTYTATRQKSAEKLQMDLLIKGRENSGINFTLNAPNGFTFSDADFALYE